MRVAILLILTAASACGQNITILPAPANHTGASCMTMKCAANTTCVDTAEGPVCQPIGHSCATTLCIATTTCVETPTGPVCQPIFGNSSTDACAKFPCPVGEVCELQQVACIREPCPPFPRCVSNNSTSAPGNSTRLTCKTVKCKADMICVDQFDGPRCVPSEGNSTVDVCANFTCPAGEICLPQDVVSVRAPCPPIPKCVPASSGNHTGASCMTMRCTANTTCVDTPTGPVCQPNGNDTVNPCATTLCAAGTICEVETIYCLVAPCPPPRAVCKPNSSTGGFGNSTDPCAAMTCPVGEVCQVEKVLCKKEPCPPRSRCVLRTTNSSACLHIKCSAGHECRNGDKGETCYPIVDIPIVDVCANHTCPLGQKCKAVQINCLVAPCPPATPSCVPQSSSNLTCATVKCTANSTCVQLPTGPVCRPNGAGSCMTVKCTENSTCVETPTGPVCQPNGNETANPCATTLCLDGTTCEVQTIYCLVAPCPPPRAVCKPNNSTGGTDNSTNPCAAMTCPVGEVCQVENVMCKMEPCPHRARCVLRTTNSSACLHIKCSAGHECRNGDKGETCYPIVDIPTVDVCANHTCPLGQKCKAVQVNCFVPPCAAIPSCVPQSSSNLTCATVKCNANSTCVQLPTGPVCQPNQGPESPCALVCASGLVCVVEDGKAKCQPKDESCALVDCASGLVCVVEDGKAKCKPKEKTCALVDCKSGLVCVEEGGKPKCVKISGTSCAATTCAVNTTCIDTMDGAKCVPGHAGGCASMTCGGGAHCVETPAGARCISGGKRDNRVVDTNGCGRGEQHTKCMPQCEETCRGVDQCDPSIPASNSSINEPEWTNSTGHGNATCISGCICRDGFKRNVQGNCVPQKRCYLTPGCRENETWTKCRGCEPTCSNPTGAKICSAMCRSGCACDEGFVRCKRGMCVLPEDCKAMDLVDAEERRHIVTIVD